MINIAGINALDLPLVFVGGLLGSSHCIGMCGGFAVAVGYQADRLTSNLKRQLLWSLGRVFTYAFGGAVLGFLGSRMGARFSWTPVQAVLAIIAGLLLIVQGLISTGVFRRKRPHLGKCPIEKYAWLLPIGRMLNPSRDSAGTRNRSAETFLAGVMTGFLPCGLVYAYLALAASSAQLWSGLMIMVAFGVGTMPVMIATGAGASLMTVNARARVFRMAAVCVVVTGFVTIGRGVAAFETSDGDTIPPCPLCEEVSTAETQLTHKP